MLAADLVPDVKGKADECKAIIKRENCIVAGGCSDVGCSAPFGSFRGSFPAVFITIGPFTTALFTMPFV